MIRRKVVGVFPIRYKGISYPTLCHQIIWENDRITFSAVTNVGESDDEKIVTDSESLKELIEHQRTQIKAMVET